MDETASWIAEAGCNFALTLTPDIRPGDHFDPETELRPILRKVAKAIAHDLRHVPKRQLGTDVAIRDTVWMNGFVELKNMWGVPYPHYHAAIRLLPGEEVGLKTLLLRRWGKGKGSLASRPVFSRYGCKPDFDLTPITDARGWIAYSCKQAALSTLIEWTHADLLG